MATTPIISIISEEDVRGIAAEHGIDIDTSLARAWGWGKHIEETASALVNEQLESCIVFDQP